MRRMHVDYHQPVFGCGKNIDAMQLCQRITHRRRRRIFRARFCNRTCHAGRNRVSVLFAVQQVLRREQVRHIGQAGTGLHLLPDKR